MAVKKAKAKVATAKVSSVKGRSVSAPGTRGGFAGRTSVHGMGRGAIALPGLSEAAKGFGKGGAAAASSFGSGAPTGAVSTPLPQADYGGFTEETNWGGGGIGAGGGTPAYPTAQVQAARANGNVSPSDVMGTIVPDQPSAPSGGGSPNAWTSTPVTSPDYMTTYSTSQSNEPATSPEDLKPFNVPGR